MLITKEVLLEEIGNINKRKHNIIFLGMSGLGKTHWSKALSQKFCYRHYEFDEMIGRSKDFLHIVEGCKGVDLAEKCGNYFGKPWDEGYAEKERRYLKIEKKLMDGKYPDGSILDLTGSAIYHLPELRKLRQTGIVICLDSSKKAINEMFNTYISHPKAVCWNGMFMRKGKESNKIALARSYKRLLMHRAELYRKNSDVIIPYVTHMNISSADDFITEIYIKLR